MGDLNGLMRFLRDEIALAGKEGATIEIILAAINQFYQNKAKQQHGNQTDVSLQNVDRAFQERVWSWLAKDRLVSIGNSKEGNSLTLNELEARNLEADPLRIFTTEQQIWIALTGNEKDTRKIPQKSFELLSIIATFREKGIIQPELVRLTGQDHRSVPSRTHKLAEAGHIKKIPVVAHGANTSLLVHTRFSAKLLNLNAGMQADNSTKIGQDFLYFGRNKFTRAEKEIRATIKLLEESENHLMIWDDVRAKLQISGTVISRCLAEGIRKLEKLGIVKRVRAPKSTVEDNAKAHLFRCVQLLRAPTEEDWRLFFRLNEQEQDKSTELGSLQDSRNETHNAGPMTSLEVDTSDEPVNNTEDVSVSLWNPDRLLAHTFYSALLEAGTAGLSTKQLKKMITGPFYARPADRFIERCVKTWQKSQPPPLQHLAIVRDSAQLGKTSFYIHFVYDAFGVKVNNKETFWEAIQSFPESNKPVSIDEYGFKILSSSIFAGKNNDLILKKALEAAEKGDQSAHIRSMYVKPRVVSRKSKPETGHPRKEQQGKSGLLSVKTRGRPRKYPNLNEPEDYSNMSPSQIEKAVLSRKRAQEYLRRKARNMVELCVSDGMSKDEAEEIATAEFGLTPESYLANTIKDPPGMAKANTKTKPRGRPPKRKHDEMVTGYLPSMVAHTTPLHSYRVSEFLEDHQKKRKKPSETGIENSPSILVHTSPTTASHTYSEINQNPITPGPKRRGRPPKNKKTLASDSRQSLLIEPPSSVPAGLTASFEKSISTRSATAPNGINKETQPPIDSNTLASEADLVESGSVHQTNGTHKKRQNEIHHPDDTTNQHEQSLSIGDDLDSALSLKRKASNHELVEPAAKRQCSISMVDPSIMTAQEGIDEMEHNNPNEDPIVTPASPLHGMDVLNGQEATQNTAVSSIPHTGTEEHQLSIINRQLAPSVSKENSQQMSTEAANPVEKISSRKRIVPFGGTIAAMRKLIILDILKSCNGIFPGDGELFYPFITAYVKKFPDAKPDTRTIKVAKKKLIEEGQIKQINFTFKATTGMVHNKTIVALPEVSETGEQVKDLQDAISKSHPYLYFPPGANIHPDHMPKSSLNAEGRISKRYVHNLPVLSTLVVPQLEPELQTQSEQGDSIVNTDPTDSPQVHNTRSEKQKVSDQHNLGSEEHSRTESPYLEQIAEKLFTHDRAGDSNPQGGMTHNKPRLSRLHSRSQNRPGEITFKIPVQFDPLEISRENQRVAPPSGEEFCFQAQFEHEPVESQIPSHQALIDQRSVDQLVADQLEAEQLAAEQLAAEQLAAEQLAAEQSAADRLAAEQWTADQALADRALIDQGSIAHPAAMYAHEMQPVNYPPLDTQYGTTITSGVRSPWVPIDAWSLQTPYPDVDPLAPFPPITNVATCNETDEDGLPVLSSGDGFVHYPFPTENFISVPIRPNPVGRKRVNKPPPEKPPKKRVRAIDNEPRKTRVRKSRTMAPKPSALELHEKQQEKTPGIRYSKSSQSQTRPIEFRRERLDWKPEMDKKLLIATLFCHIACGGVREENHWTLVAKMLSNKYDKDQCRRRWTTVRIKYRGDLEVISQELRSGLLDSYEKDEIPKLDYAHIGENDWDGMMAWALDKIENPKSEDIELPASRDAFESAFSIQEFPPRNPPDFFENKRIASLTVRHFALNTGARVLTREPKNSVTELEAAKSYVLANLLTPEDTYDAEKAREKLLRFPEATIEQATSSLVADKSINQTNRGRAAPGRTYDISRFYLKAMQWKLSVAHFKYAAAFKEILDKKLEMDGKMQYKQAFGNGEMITLINLLADGFLELDGKDVPNKKFGLATEGYKTRSIDKKSWNFTIHMKPREKYTNGFPCRPLPQPPSPRYDLLVENTTLPCNPLWIDINGDLLPVMWDLALAAVSTVLVINTGSNAENVAKKLQPCVAAFEVELIMQWLVDAGAAEWKDRENDCLSLNTWWWSVITTPIAKNANGDEAAMIAGQRM